MKVKSIFFSLLIALAGASPATTFAQQEEDVRGAFMTTRPKATPKSNKAAPTTKPSRRRPKGPVVPVPDPIVKNNDKPGTPAKVNIPRIGMGLTLFMRDSNGLSVRTDPTRQFVKGDHVRFLVETSADGYLYVFNTTDGGQPVMIYPDPEVDEAGNYFQSHVPFEIPSSLAAEERLRWFTFDQNAGAEKLYFVFSREPLAAVPMEDDLITYCRENTGKCPWNPGTEVWAQIEKELGEPIKVSKAQGLGNAQTAPERQASTRGIGLNRDDPEPSLIMLTASTSKNMLVVAIDLVHKSLSLVEVTGEEGNPH